MALIALMIIVKPFLRWAGGKNWLIKELHKFLPDKFNNYYEPFLGGGSVFFYLKSQGFIQNSSYLSDLNGELVETYQLIKSKPNDIINRLSSFKNEQEFYYNMRSQVFTDSVDNAAKFLYLNRTSFNGIYRVNKNGEYNVPFGNRSLAKLFDLENLVDGSNMLSDTSISCMDFFDTIETIKKGDLIFLDPPYTVAHENNGFVKYNQKIFAWEDQIRLNEFLVKLNKLGAYFIMTNAAHISIEELYKDIGIYSKVNRPSSIGGKGAKRTAYNELIFTNIVNGK